MNRELWKHRFWKLPSWICPHCESGTLTYQNGDLIAKSSEGTMESFRDGYLEPTDLNGPFVAWMTCSNLHCTEKVIVSGHHDVVETSDDWNGREFTARYYPVYIYPAPPIISRPEATPDAVDHHLTRSFGLYWSDPVACAGAMRTAIERLADAVGVPKEWAPGHWMTLSKRIGILEQTHPLLAEAADAIKGLGNEGAHGDEIDKGRLLAAFDLLEIELQELFNDRNVRRAQLLKDISKKRK